MTQDASPTTSIDESPTSVSSLTQWAWLGRCVNDPERFLAEDWAIQPSVSRAAESRFAALFSLDELDRILAMGVLENAHGMPPRIKMVKENMAMPDAGFMRKGETGHSRTVIDCGRVAELMRKGGTIIVNGISDFAPMLFELCSGLEHEISHHVNANAYLTPPNSQGFKVHQDSHDVIILQISGTKKWQVFNPPPDVGLRSADAAAESAPPVPLDVILRPGDTLYIPRGWPHAAMTAGDVSLHVTIGIMQASILDLLRCALDVPASRSLLQKPLPVGFCNDATPLSAALTEGYQNLAQILTDPAGESEAIQGFIRSWRHKQTRDRPGQLVEIARELTEK